VVYFYGGSWREGSKIDYRFVAQALTSRGFIVVLPDYRLYPQMIFPAFAHNHEPCGGLLNGFARRTPLKNNSRVRNYS